jgi:hypothetical protein
MSRRGRLSTGIIAVALCLIVPRIASATLIGISGVGADTATLMPIVDQFRTTVGDPNNGNGPGVATGRREINWDGGGTATSPGGTPFDVFLNNRGARMTTPGDGFVQAPDEFNPGMAEFFGQAGYRTEFDTFSLQRLFAPVDSNITDVFFFVPGTNGATTATVSGFGSVFTDVDLANSTTLQFFDINNVLLGSLAAPVLGGSGGLSFVGGFFNAGEQVFRVRITTGTGALGVADSALFDAVAMDDFVFSEPQAVPEPATLVLTGLGLLYGARSVRRRHRQHTPRVTPN